MLDLCHVFSDDVAGALACLERPAGLSPQNAKAKWVLANAYLRAGRIDDTWEVLELLVTDNAEFASEAQKLLEKLRP